MKKAAQIGGYNVNGIMLYAYGRVNATHPIIHMVL